ncbi:MAG TPA: pseudouridine synthase [Candidatus Angelobacter sp.]|nr:pseudouridine synthase [Candidatus Angelobacter sp.]
MPHRYILFNKPFGVLCQFSGEGPTLKKYVPVQGVYAAGRLDRDSEGLLLLTDDGELQHRLTDPRFAHPRTYWVQVEGVPGAGDLKRLASGVEIQGYRTRPTTVRLFDQETALPPRDPPIRFRKNVSTAWLEITLIEGRNRQVRRMTAAVGHPTLRLVRVAIGRLSLRGLDPGKWKEIPASELAELKKALSLA